MCVCVCGDSVIIMYAFDTNKVGRIALVLTMHLWLASCKLAAVSMQQIALNFLRILLLLFTRNVTLAVAAAAAAEPACQ